MAPNVTMAVYRLPTDQAIQIPSTPTSRPDSTDPRDHRPFKLRLVPCHAHTYQITSTSPHPQAFHLLNHHPCPRPIRTFSESRWGLVGTTTRSGNQIFITLRHLSEGAGGLQRLRREVPRRRGCGAELWGRGGLRLTFRFRGLVALVREGLRRRRIQRDNRPFIAYMDDIPSSLKSVPLYFSTPIYEHFHRCLRSLKILHLIALMVDNI